MYVLFVKAQVKPEHLDEFLKTTASIDAKGSVGNEPGCYRFDVLQDETDPNVVYFYEVYQDKAAFAAHSQAPHFFQWRDAVNDWMAKPTEVVRAFTYFPENADWRKQPL